MNELLSTNIGLHNPVPVTAGFADFSSPVGWLLLAAVVALLLLARYVRSQRDNPARDSGTDFTCGARCPNCGTNWSDPVGSFENRRCGYCGQRFSLK